MVAETRGPVARLAGVDEANVNLMECEAGSRIYLPEQKSEKASLGNHDIQSPDIDADLLHRGLDLARIIKVSHIHTTCHMEVHGTY